jgi:hypothetical protein
MLTGEGEWRGGGGSVGRDWAATSMAPVTAVDFPFDQWLSDMRYKYPRSCLAKVQVSPICST